MELCACALIILRYVLVPPNFLASSNHGPMATPTDCSIPKNGDIDESSTINGEAEASLTHQTRITSRSILEQWYDVTNRREMTLVTVGRSGSGKSTLISSMLGLKDVDTLQGQHTSSPVTQEVEIYSGSSPLRAEGGEVTIHMVDTPDLNSSFTKDARAMALLQEKTGGGRCDMLLYCVSLLPDSKIDKEDKEIIKKLTQVFGEDIWKHTVLVLTFSNAVKALYPNQSIEHLVNQYAQKFQTILRSVCGPSFSVVSVFSHDQHSPTQTTETDPFTVVALPVGKHPKEQYFSGVGWAESILSEVLKKSKTSARTYYSSVPTILKANFPTPRIFRLPALLAELFVGTLTMTAVGAGTCGYIGAALDPLIRKFIVGKCDMHSCAAIATVMGVAVIGPLALVRVVASIQERESKQLELDHVQREANNYRK
jgi:GTPase SAR1 family protein